MTNWSDGTVLAEGKTKVVIAHEDPALAIIQHKDDITAGDGARRNTLPGKGALSGRTTANVFQALEAAGISTHFIDAPEDDVMVVRRCAMIPLEVVMRRIATGSYLKRQPVAEGTRFDPLVVETFYKDDANHDPMVDADWIEQHGIATPEEIASLDRIGRQVFEGLERVWAAQDVQLVDLKIEFGRDLDGNLLVADVIDNDSWRLWPGGRKEEMLDKQVYRNITEVTDEKLRTVLAKYRQVAAMSDGFLAGDKPREACGVFGIWGGQGADVASTTLLGLMALQHRGQESAGVAVLDEDLIRVTRGMGRVDQIFRQAPVEAMRGSAAVGHTRYSTTGESRIENAQPLMVERGSEAVALAHNGNIVNPLELREMVVARGGQPVTTSDSELLAWLVLLSDGTWEERIREMMRVSRGAYSLAILTNDAVFAVRDPLGLRPLCLGWRDEHWMIASESCALDTVGAELIRDIEPGEILRIDTLGLRGALMEDPPRPALCVFEQIYFARPDSVIGGMTGYEARVAMGRQLATEHPVHADMVIGVPDSGVPAAIGFAQESGIPLAEGLVKNRYIGRTFIQPDQHSRQAGIRLKFNPLRGAVKGKRVVVVDDSVVRGNTMPKIVELLRRGGATAVHLRISSPPIAHPCFFGIDMGARDGLIANGRNVEEIRQYLGADTLGYLSIPGLQKAVGDDRRCFGCLTGRYPVRVDEQVRKDALERQLAVADPSGLDVLVVGSGGREHALAWALRRSPSVRQVYAAPGNPGIAEVAELVDIQPTDTTAMAEWAAGNGIGLVVVGPEASLAAGMADRMEQFGIPVFGASKAAAELEWSKVFAKRFMQQHDIPTADYAMFTNLGPALGFLSATRYPLVVKADGLAAGKGVTICATREEAEQAVREALGGRFGAAGARVVIEEFLEGSELSVIALCDGERIQLLPSARDHKRLLDGDQGPNTGGMGAFAPVLEADDPILREAVERVLQPTVDGLRAIGRPYRGALYAGLMVTPAGIKVLEFNCRFGDPETQAIVPLIEGDLAQAMLSCARGSLIETAIWQKAGAAVCVTLAAAGYPAKPEAGASIVGVESAEAEGSLIFHAGTARIGRDLVTAGGRVMSVVGVGETVDRAVERAYFGADRITFAGKQVRRDIAANKQSEAVLR